MSGRRGRWFPLAEVAEQTTLSVEQLRRLINAGKLSAVVIDFDDPALIFVTPGQLMAFTRAHTCPWPGWALPHDHPDRATRQRRPPPAGSPPEGRDDESRGPDLRGQEGPNRGAP
jgi:hypothetical protein